MSGVHIPVDNLPTLTINELKNDIFIQKVSSYLLTYNKATIASALPQPLFLFIRHMQLFETKHHNLCGVITNSGDFIQKH